MNTKKIIIILSIVLLLSIGILIYLKKKKSSATVNLPAPEKNTSAPNNLTVKQVVAPKPVDTTDSNKTSFPLKKGSTGKAVKIMQMFFGLPITGTFDDAMNYQCGIKNHSNQITAQDFIDWVTPNPEQFPAQKGSSGEVTTVIQILCGTEADGKFGNNTANALYSVTGSQSINSYLEYFTLISAVLGISISYNNATQSNTTVTDNNAYEYVAF